MNAVKPSTHDLVSELAFHIYEQEGHPEGRAIDHWTRAERAVAQLRLSEAPKIPDDFSRAPTVSG